MPHDIPIHHPHIRSYMRQERFRVMNGMRRWSRVRRRRITHTACDYSANERRVRLGKNGGGGLEAQVRKGSDVIWVEFWICIMTNLMKARNYLIVHRERKRITILQYLACVRGVSIDCGKIFIPANAVVLHTWHLK